VKPFNNAPQLRTAPQAKKPELTGQALIDDIEDRFKIGRAHV
jgi:hypothetical protein